MSDEFVRRYDQALVRACGRMSPTMTEDEQGAIVQEEVQAMLHTWNRDVSSTMGERAARRWVVLYESTEGSMPQGET